MERRSRSSYDVCFQAFRGSKTFPRHRNCATTTHQTTKLETMLCDGLENTSAQSALSAATTGCAQRITLFLPPPDWSPQSTARRSLDLSGDSPQADMIRTLSS